MSVCTKECSLGIRQMDSGEQTSRKLLMLTDFVVSGSSALKDPIGEILLGLLKERTSKLPFVNSGV
jgi:hypothetical protein